MTHPLTPDQLLHRLTSTEFTPLQKRLLRLLYESEVPLTRTMIAQKLFEDGNPQRVAGVLSELSKDLVPEKPDDAYALYLSVKGTGDRETLGIGAALRLAIESSAYAKQMLFEE